MWCMFVRQQLQDEEDRGGGGELKVFSVAYLKVVSMFNSVFAAGLEMGTSF